MAEHRLTARPPLGGPAADMTVGPLRIVESMEMALASVATRRGREADLAGAALAAGIPLGGPGRWERGARWSSAWIGPDQWMLEAAVTDHEDVVAHLAPLLGDAGSITEQTDGWARFEVTGPLGPLLERLCNLDLDAFGPGSATRTTMEHVGVLVLRRAADRATLLAGRSSAGSLHHALVAAARSAF